MTPETTRLQELTRESFAAHLEEAFRVPAEDQALELRLIEAEPLPGADLHASGSAGRRAPFSLLFRGPDAPCLGQGLWALEHDALGRLELFVVPIGQDKEGLLYEAVFN